MSTRFMTGIVLLVLTINGSLTAGVERLIAQHPEVFDPFFRAQPLDPFTILQTY